MGHPPGLVSRSMSEFSVEIQDTLIEIDRLYRISDSTIPPAAKLIRCVQLLAAAFVYFLEIHPYANGNGHMGRLILIAGLRRQGIFITGWPLHPRPADPPYSEAIKQYRSGNKTPLEHFILSCL
ncbi:Fic family protein [Bradyrhizobium sp. JYMT SZCCT0428]|nr:Fic family protein [Bradyrhizobium sp. JYMT SZCCT0428]